APPKTRPEVPKPPPKLPDRHEQPVAVRELRRITGHTGVVCSVRFSPDGQRLASASEDKTVRLWDVGTGQELRSLSHAIKVPAVAWTLRGKVLSGTADGQIILWDAEAGKELARLKGHTDFVHDLAVSADGHYAMSCGIFRDSTVRSWDLGSAKQLTACSGQA